MSVNNGGIGCLSIVILLSVLVVIVASCDTDGPYKAPRKTYHQQQEQIRRGENRAWLADVCREFPSACRK